MVGGGLGLRSSGWTSTSLAGSPAGNGVMIGFGCAHNIKLTLEASTLRYGLVIFITMKLVRMFIPGSSRAGLPLIELTAAGFASNRCQLRTRQSPDHDAARGNQPDVRYAPDSITSPSRA